MSIQSEINRLRTAKTNLASAIESKGVDVSDTATLSDYPALVSAISVGSQNNPDWEQNDNTKDDYIKNRTHWKEVGTGGDEVVYFQNSSLTVDSDGVYGDSTPISVEIGTTVNVDWDDATYQCDVLELNIESYSIKMLGNQVAFGGDDSGEPFCIVLNYNTNDASSGKTIASMDSKSGTHSVKIYKAGDVTYHKLSNKYLNIDETPTENSENLITSGAVYNVAAKNSSKGTFLVKLSYSSGYVADKTFGEMSEAIDLGYNVVVEFLGNSFVHVTYRDSNSMEFTNIYEKSQIFIKCTSSNVWTISQSGTFFETKNIANNLTTNDSTKVLSAAQGKALNDKINNLNIPTVADWAKAPEKPTYTASEVSADERGAATSAVTTHNVDTSAHNDIRLKIKELSDNLNAVANSTDEDLDTLAEIVAYIKNNKSLIDNVTTSKVNVSDIINDLTTNVSNKPLSAAQGVALKGLIDKITVPTKISQLTNDSGFLTSIPSEYITETELNAKNIVVGNGGSYAINVTTKEPTDDNKSVITIVI